MSKAKVAPKQAPKQDKKQAKRPEMDKGPGTRAEAPPRMLLSYRDTVVPQMTKEFD